MLPFPKLFNNYQNPPRPKFLVASDVIYRQDVSGSVYRPAVEGTEFEFDSQDNTIVKFTRFNTFFSINVPQVPGKSVFLRFKFNGVYDRCVLQPWNNGALFTYGITPNQWYELKVDFYPTGRSRWYVNNTLQYDNSLSSVAGYFFGLFGGPNSVEFDIGSNGGTPPAGYVWWYNPRT